MNGNKNKYLHFPIDMLQNLFIDKSKTISEIMDFGICYFAKSRIGETVDKKIQNSLKDIGIKYNNNVEKLTKIFTLKVMKMGSVPMGIVEKSQAFEFRDYSKSEWQLVMFASNIALLSIIGSKPYIRTNKQHLISRMFGFYSVKHAQYFLDKKFMKPEILSLWNKYQKRYHQDKILTELELHYKYHIYGNHIRGVYIGLQSKISMKELIQKADESKKNTKVADLMNLKKSLLQEIRNEKKGQKFTASPQHNNNIISAMNTAKTTAMSTAS